LIEKKKLFGNFFFFFFFFFFENYFWRLMADFQGSSRQPLLAPQLIELPDHEDEYYSSVRLVLLTALLLLATHVGALLYTRWSLGIDPDEVCRDTVASAGAHAVRPACRTPAALFAPCPPTDARAIG